MPLTSNLFVPRPVMVWKQMVSLVKKISAPNLSPQSASNPNLNLVCIYYFRQTSLWDGFLFHRSKCFAISPSQLKIFAVLCVPQCCCTPQSCTLGLQRAAPLAVAPAGAIAHPMPSSSCASTSQLWVECAVLAQPALPSSAIQFVGVSVLEQPSTAPSSVLIISSASFLGPTALSDILVLGISRGEPTNSADYFLLLNNCPQSKILWLSNHLHWGAKQLLIQGASSGKVSSIKQWST